MRVLLGNENPHDQGTPIPGPTVTISDIKDATNEDGSYTAGYIVGTSASEVKEHLYDAEAAGQGQVTHLPGNEALLNVVMSWRDHAKSKPAWVSVEPAERDPAEAEDFERFLSEFWKCDRGVPSNLEDTHYTQYTDSDTIYAPGEKPEGE